MKRLRGLFDNPLSLLIILALVIVAILSVSGRAMPGFSGGTTTATAAQDATADQKGERNNDRDLWVANAAEKEEKNLLFDAGQDKTVIRCVWWSPDGGYLFIFSDVPGDNGLSGHYGGIPGHHFESHRLTLATK